MSMSARRPWRTILVATALLAATFSPSLAVAFCGDGVLEPNEICDDGNTAVGDCCDDACQYETNGSSCTDDGNQCTIDSCNGEGTCNHVIRQGGCDDGNGCTAGDTCNTDGFCVPGEVAPDGSNCADRNYCGGVGTCSGGFCYGNPVGCEGYASACDTAACNPQTGACDLTPIPDGTACGGGNFCHPSGACSAGECIQELTDCSSLADDCNTAYCDVEMQRCATFPKENGTSCDDGNGCTVSDSCTDGFCDGAPRDCSGLTDACNVGFCNGDLGDCQADARPNGETCDDGNTCTTDDQCMGGACGGAPADCSAFDSACQVGTCNATSGACEAAAKPDGETCDDGNSCSTGDSCSGGTCGGSPKDCSAFDAACTFGSCNPDTGACGAAPKQDGAECNDGNLCTTSDQCASGECAGSAVQCAGRHDCQFGACNPDTGACVDTPVADGETCDDRDNCTTADQCSGGSCGGSIKDCSAFNGACTTGTCNTTSGACEAAAKPDGETCDDGNSCSTGDQCSGGACAGSPKDCSGLDGQCTTGACNPQNGACVAQAKANGIACDDGAFCTKTDTCIAGVCSGSGDPCAGGPACASTCNEGADNCNAARGTACPSDGNPCTDDVCDGEGHCAGLANTAACDDGLFCTSNDRCADGACTGSETCPSNRACGDMCNETENACRTCGHPFSNSRCIVNAVVVLQGALALRPCEVCTCDVDNNGSVTVTDALRILRKCTALPGVLTCPTPTTTTTTTTTLGVTTTTFIP